MAPTFPRVEASVRFPASAPVVEPSPAAYGGLEAQSLRRLSGVLTQIGADREREATRLARETEVTTWSTRLAEQSLTLKDQIARETDPDRLRALRDRIGPDLEAQLRDITDPVVRGDVRRRAAAAAVSIQGVAGDRVFTLEQDRGRRAVADAVDAKVRQAVSDPDPAARYLAEMEVEQDLLQATSNGFFTAEQSGAAWRTARQTIATGRIQAAILANPTEAGALLADPGSSLARSVTEPERRQFLEQARALERSRLNDALALDRAIEEQVGRQEAQALEDRLFARFPDDPEGALAAARTEIRDAKRRDDVVGRLKVRFDEAKSLNATRQAETFFAASQRIEQGQGVADLEPEALATLSSAQIQALETRARQKRRGLEPVNEDRLYHSFVAKTADEIAAIKEGDLWATYRHRLDDRHWEAVQTTWTQAVEAKATKRANPELTDFLNTQEQIRNALGTAGIIPRGTTPAQLSPADATKLARFEQTIARDLEAFERAKGKKATPSERQTLIDERLRETVRVRRNPVTGFFLEDPERPAVFARDEDPARLYVPLAQIPQTAVGEALTALRAYRVVPPGMSDADAIRTYQRRIEEAWAARRMGRPVAERLEILRGRP